MPTERIQRRIDALLDETDAAAGALDWPRVRELCDGILRLDPDNEDARAYLAAASRTPESRPSVAADVAARSGAPTPPAGPPLPAAFAAGRYRVVRLLGEGGRKRVFLAHDTRLDREVAFALIRTDGLDATGRQRVLREAQSVARLGQHPNLVTVHDIGEDDGHPYIVQEYMSGGDVAQLVAERGTARAPGTPGTGREATASPLQPSRDRQGASGTSPPSPAQSGEGGRGDEGIPVARTLAIARDVCRGLAFIHERGMVHRDLKPQNVFLGGDGSARIGDFGLAVAFDQSRLTMHGMLVGTVAYMPPEQALGNETTPRADLYSLGCMLYEMVSGRPPFVSDNPTAVISQHINTPPVAPSWHTNACPQDLETLILRLLAKDPAERPASADEVLAALELIDPAQESASHSDSNALDRLALGVFVGREKELERLRKAFDNAVAGHGGLVMLVGEPGIGKTRTTQELETYAKMRGAQVLWGRTHESAGAPPYFPWLQAGNQYVAAHVDDLPTLITPHMPPGATAELSRIFPWLRQQPNFVEPEQVSDPEVAQFRLFDAYTSYLKAIAMQGPLVVAIDDLHWADKPTLQLLQHIARELSRMRVLVVANYRDTDITRQSALSETLASLNRESGFDRIVLRGLSREEVGAYIRARANVEPRREVLDRIFEETEGNAFFLGEVVNLMAQEGTLTKTSISDIAIPDGVKEALGRRLNRLSEETNELLQIAAIIGRDFAYDTLTLLGERDEDALLKMIEEALEARVIEETEQAGRYRFTHAQMQETLLAELSTTRRVRLQGQVGEALEQRYGARADERAARLAQHFAEAATLAPRFSEKAAKYSSIAGRQAFDQAAYQEAARHFRAALSAREGQETDDDLAGLLFSLGKACDANIEYREAWRCFRQAFAHYAGTGRVAEAVDLAEFAGSSFAYLAPTQTGMIERALELVEEGSAQYGRLHAALGFSVGMLGNDNRAQEAFSRAREVAARLGLPSLELAGQKLEMVVDTFHGRNEASMPKAERVIELARQLADPGAEFLGHFFAANKLFIGDLAGGSAHADAARALAERSRVWGRVVAATHLQAYAAVLNGDWAGTRTALERGLELGPRDGRLLWEMAVMLLLLGDTAAAEEYLARLVEVGGASRGPTLENGLVAQLLPSAGFLTGRAADRLVMAQTAEAVLSSPAPATPLIAMLAHQGLAIDAFLDNEPEAVRVQFEALQLFRGQVWGTPSTDHIRSLLLLTLGRRDDAIDELEGALVFLGKGYWPGYAWAAYDCARIRLERNGPGDRERALTLIDEAMGHAQKLGMKPLVERILALKLQDQGIGTTGDIYTSIVAVADSVQRDRPDLRAQAAPDGTVTLMFSDIEGSTALNEQLGDARWMELLKAHNAVIDAQVKAHGGHTVKTMGDGYMVAFPSAAAGLRCAIAIQRALQESRPPVGAGLAPIPGAPPGPGAPPAMVEQQAATGGRDSVRVRIGLHTGEAVRDGDDFYGRHVNFAARVAASAVGGEVLVSSLVRGLVAPAGEFAFDDGREVELKGITGRHRVYAARPA
jgi:serine/threonine protein kinase/class 3 adenylate cyclase